MTDASTFDLNRAGDEHATNTMEFPNPMSDVFASGATTAGSTLTGILWHGIGFGRWLDFDMGVIWLSLRMLSLLIQGKEIPQ
jgi:hypothetical protein